MTIFDFITTYLQDVLSAVSPQYRQWIIGTLAVFLVQLFAGGLIQLLFSCIGQILNVRGVRGKK